MLVLLQAIWGSYKLFGISAVRTIYETQYNSIQQHYCNSCIALSPLGLTIDSRMHLKAHSMVYNTTDSKISETDKIFYCEISRSIVDYYTHFKAKKIGLNFCYVLTSPHNCLPPLSYNVCPFYPEDDDNNFVSRKLYAELKS